RTADGTVGPRWSDPPTEAELEGKIYNYAYSSIMDYSRLTIDKGPGRYDAAAILLGYADKVEGFKDTTGIPSNDPVWHEWSASDGQVITFTFPVPSAFHYTQWYAKMGTKFNDESNREFADAKDVNWDTSVVNTSAGPKKRVPYIFCSPYQSDIGNGC